MSFFQRYRLFQKLVGAIAFSFFAVMAFVVTTAYSRTSGSTGLDMGKVQKLRAGKDEIKVSRNP